MTAYEWADICKSAITYCIGSVVPVHIETSLYMPAPYDTQTLRIRSPLKIEGIGEAGMKHSFSIHTKKTLLVVKQEGDLMMR